MDSALRAASQLAHCSAKKKTTQTRMHGKAEPDGRPVLFFTVCEPKYSTAIEN